VMDETCRVVSSLSKPSSRGSHTSVMSVELISVTWWRPGILLLIISAIVTVLLMARPMAFSATSLAPFSLKSVVA